MSTLEDRYRSMLEHAADAFFSADVEGRLEWVSPAIRNITGEPADQLLGHDLADFVIPEDRPGLHAAYRSALAGDQVLFHGRVVHESAVPRWVVASGAPLRDADGNVVSIVGTIRDIDEMVAAREQLAESEAEYRLLAEHTGDVVVRVDAEMKITWVSPSVRHVLGFEPADLVGVTIVSLVHADDWHHIVEPHHLRRHHSSGAMPSAFVVRVQREDGRYLWMRSRPVPIVDHGVLLGAVSTLTDVTDLVEAREEAEERKHRLAATLDTLMDPCIVLEAVRDRHGAIVDFVHLEANDAAKLQFHPLEPQMVGLRITETVVPFVAPQLVEMLARVVTTGEPLNLDDYSFQLPDGQRDSRRFDLRAVKVGDGVSHVWRDVTVRRAEQEHLEHLATHDPLTGLANRAALVDDLERALSTGRRSGRPAAAIMFDLDHFKQVNDAYGHAVGDELLQAAARRLDGVVRSGDLTARLGGDEFVVVMRDLDDPREALRVANRIVAEFRLPVVASGHELHTTASVGVAVGHGDVDAAELLAEADEAMYRAKRDGRDHVELYNDDLRQAANARLTLEAQLRPALDLGELAVHYQPEVDLLTGRICAVEALLRWHHPSGELFPAERFIDVAEDIGVIVDSGNWAVREACSQVALWHAAHPDRPVVLRVNVSPQQLAEVGLLPSFAQAISESGVPATMVSVELSEAVLMHPTATVVANLDGLRAMGIHLVIDRFGTGYAALAQLRDRRVDMVKIDRSFVRDITLNDYSRRLVRGIVALAGAIDVHVSAEGVETVEQADILLDLGVTVAQGYLFAPALSARELAARLMVDQPFRR